VAPAFATVYLGLGYVRRVWVAGSGRGKYGGAKRRAQVWESIRRVERLLNTLPSTKPNSRTHHTHDQENKEGTIPALTSGLLLLSVTRLRAYAETQLPARSKLRAGFLEDIEDLEDPSFTRTQKLRVIERMWRCWSHVLGWERIVAERK
jgi:nuclear control of ATPase protein 2